MTKRERVALDHELEVLEALLAGFEHWWLLFHFIAKMLWRALHGRRAEKSRGRINQLARRRGWRNRRWMSHGVQRSRGLQKKNGCWSKR